VNEIHELSIAELDSVSGGDDKPKDPPKDPLPKLPEDPVITVARVLGGVIWFL
jgi:bacteriocin-like protein